MILFQLFYEFFKVGLFAVGGGMATIPFLYDMGEKTGWFTRMQVADMLAISESTPGPIGVNMATYVGFTVGSQELGGPVMGVVAAIIATLGLVAPSVIVIMIVAYFLKRFRSSKLVDGALYGLRPASVALISAAGVDIVLIAVLRVDSIYQIAQAALSWKALALAALVYVSTHIKKLKNLHPIWFIAASAVIGVVLKMG